MSDMTASTAPNRKRGLIRDRKVCSLMWVASLLRCLSLKSVSRAETRLVKFEVSVARCTLTSSRWGQHSLSAFM